MTAPTDTRHLGLAVMLTAAMAVGTLTQFLVGALGPVLIPDLDLSRTEFGVVTASFFVAGAVLSPVAGRWTDELGGLPLVALTFFTAGLGFGVMGIAQSHLGLVLGSVIAGIAGAAANPATNLMVAEEVPDGRRGTLIGIKQSGVQIGAFVSGFLPAASTVIGWRGVMFACAATSLAGTALAAPGFRQRRPRRPRRDRAGSAGTGRDRISPWLAPYAVLMGIGGAAVSTYLPLYAYEEGGFSASRAGLLAAVIGLIGIVARILWARLSERVDAAAGPLAIIGVGSVVSLGLFLLVLVDLAPALWLGALLFGASGAAWNSVGMLAIIRGSDVRAAGRVSGRVLAGFYFGLVIGPVPFGFAVDQTGSYVGGWAAVAAIYLASVVLAVAWGRRMARDAAAPVGQEG